MPESPATDGTFAVFSFAFGLVLLFGMSSEQMVGTPLGVAVCLTSLAVLVFPSSTWALGIASLTYIVHFAVDDYRMPFVHTTFDAFCSTVVLVGLATSKTGDPRAWRTRFVRIAGGPAIGLAAIAFFAAGFAKLNVDFLSPEVSCGAIFYAWTRSVLPYSILMPGGPLGDALAIYGTLVIELTAPLLWLHHRTRRIGFFLGMILLFLLGTNPYARYYVFVGPFIALLTLGFDHSELVARVRGLGARAHTGLRGAIVVAVGLAMTLGATPVGVPIRHFVARIVFVVGALVVVAFTLRAPSVRLARRRPSLGFVVVVALFLFELLPYAGLKHPRNFTMAANFHIFEGYSNHLIVPRPLPIPARRQLGRWFDLELQGSFERPIQCGKRRPGESESDRIERGKHLERR